MWPGLLSATGVAVTALVAGSSLPIWPSPLALVPENHTMPFGATATPLGVEPVGNSVKLPVGTL